MQNLHIIVIKKKKCKRLPLLDVVNQPLNYSERSNGRSPAYKVIRVQSKSRNILCKLMRNVDGVKSEKKRIRRERSIRVQYLPLYETTVLGNAIQYYSHSSIIKYVYIIRMKFS
jgi:hypothetical protein